MRSLLQRLLLASQWGASLALAAGCGSSVETGGGGTGGGGTTTSSTTTTPVVLDPAPDAACSGPVYMDDFGYHGQCCEEVICAPPVNGACPSADNPSPAVSSQLPPGSGTCGCSPLHGPYANTDAASADICCYLVGSIGCDGRPLIVDGAPRLAPVRAGKSAWSSGKGRLDITSAVAAIDTSGLSDEHRRVIAERWIERGRFEHASVASFGRFALSLMALGAPPALLEAAHQAALDEIEHARLCLSIASAYAGEPLAVGPLPIEGAFADVASLEAAAIGTVIEGCVGETLAALEAAEAAALAGPGAVASALSVIAEDEARHAELGWAFVRWAVTVGGERVRVRVAAAFDQAMRAIATHEQDRTDVPQEHGFLCSADVQSLRRRALAEVIEPARAALLDASRISPPAQVSVSRVS